MVLCKYCWMCVYVYVTYHDNWYCSVVIKDSQLDYIHRAMFYCMIAASVMSAPL